MAQAMIGRGDSLAFGSKRLNAKAPIKHVDFMLLFATASLTAVGCLAIRSASQPRIALGLDPNFFLKRQLIYLAVALIAFLITLIFDYRQARNLSPILYGTGVLMLIVILTPLGHTQKGAQRWIDFGILQVQPSELMKMILIVTLAALLARERTRHGLTQVAITLAIAGVPALLVYVQPDLGTAMVLFAIVFALLLAAGTPIRWILAVVLAGTLMLGLAVQFGVLKDYQVARLTAFLDSDTDPQRAGFNLTQSKIAIGSGGLSGKGFGQGSQTNLAYVPHQHTDFIFTAVGEEQGFMGALVVLALFALLLWRCLRIAMLSKDRFGTLVAVGIAAMIGFQMFLNIGMTIGIMPITGIPLPFMSFGGSSLITSFISVGLLMNIHMRRFV